MEANDCQWLPTHHPARVALCSPFGCAGADLSGELAVLKMAAHPSQLSQAVSVAFNLACNFPREVCKSHKQNLNAIKCGLQPVNTSLCTKLCCISAALNYPEIKKLPNSAYSPMCYRSLHTVVTSICSLSTHMHPNGQSEPCALQGRWEKTFPGAHTSCSWGFFAHFRRLSFWGILLFGYTASFSALLL